MTPRDWQRTREEQHARTGHRCEACGVQRWVRLDVIRNGRGYRVLCRGCRVREQAPAITAKRLATLRRGRPFPKQTALPLETTT